MTDDIRKAIAEFIGAFGLTFAVGGASTTGFFIGAPSVVAVASPRA